MTDAEIIKALECCMDEMGCTKGCPCFDAKAKGSHCTVSKKFELEKLTLALINRQKAENEALKHYYGECLKALKNANAENERLKEENEILSKNADTAFQDGLNEAQEVYAEQIKNEVKAEAIKEIADKAIQRICETVSAPTPTESYIVEKCNEAICKVKKEMAGDTE